MPADVFGYAATFLNLIMLIPQVIQTWKTKQTKGLSLATLTMFLAASLLWGTYGILKSAPPIIMANAVLGTLNLLLIIFKFKYRN